MNSKEMSSDSGLDLWILLTRNNHFLYIRSDKAEKRANLPVIASRVVIQAWLKCAVDASLRPLRRRLAQRRNHSPGETLIFPLRLLRVMNVTAEFGGHQAGMHRARHHVSACFIGDKNSGELLSRQQ
jgi:hypothetical protein